MIDQNTKDILHKRDEEAHKMGDMEFDAMTPGQHLAKCFDLLDAIDLQMKDLRDLIKEL